MEETHWILGGVYENRYFHCTYYSLYLKLREVYKSLRLKKNWVIKNPTKKAALIKLSASIHVLYELNLPTLFKISI